MTDLSQGSTSVEKPRYYYVDWVRTIAVHYVVWIHCNCIAAEINLYNINNNPDIDTESETVIEAFNKEAFLFAGMIRVMCQFGIPAFFYMSGFAATFFNTEKHGFMKYLK